MVVATKLMMLIWQTMKCLQVLRRLLNLGCAGAELWALYQAAEACRHCLSTEVIPNNLRRVDLPIGLRLLEGLSMV